MGSLKFMKINNFLNYLLATLLITSPVLSYAQGEKTDFENTGFASSAYESEAAEAAAAVSLDEANTYSTLTSRVNPPGSIDNQNGSSGNGNGNQNGNGNGGNGNAYGWVPSNGGTNVPLDGGLSILAAAALGYGIRRSRKSGMCEVA